jgi:hypothetical protein
MRVHVPFLVSQFLIKKTIPNAERWTPNIEVD